MGAMRHPASAPRKPSQPWLLPQPGCVAREGWRAIRTGRSCRRSLCRRTGPRTPHGRTLLLVATGPTRTIGPGSFGKDVCWLSDRCSTRTLFRDKLRLLRSDTVQTNSPILPLLASYFFCSLAAYKPESSYKVHVAIVEHILNR